MGVKKQTEEPQWDPVRFSDEAFKPGGEFYDPDFVLDFDDENERKAFVEMQQDFLGEAWDLGGRARVINIVGAVCIFVLAHIPFVICEAIIEMFTGKPVEVGDFQSFLRFGFGLSVAIPFYRKFERRRMAMDRTNAALQHRADEFARKVLD